MKVEDQIDFMINSLIIAKEELSYAREYKKHEKADRENKKGWYQSYSYTHRAPNATLIRENLKTVGRLATIVSKRIKLSPYHDDITD